MELFDAAALERESPEFAAELARRHDAHHYPGYWRELVAQVRANVENELKWTEDDLRRIPVPTLCRLLAKVRALKSNDPYGIDHLWRGR